MKYRIRRDEHGAEWGIVLGLSTEELDGLLRAGTLHFTPEALKEWKGIRDREKYHGPDARPCVGCYWCCPSE